MVFAGEKNKPSTLYGQIVKDIEGHILSGDWPPGFRIPFEVDLARTYKCSRMTVNKAMAQLVNSGLIVRHKKSGSFVTEPRSQSAILEIHDIAKEVESLNRAYRYELISSGIRQVTPGSMTLLPVEEQTSVLDLSSLHWAGNHPFCFEERVINASLVPEVAGVDFGITTASQWLLQRVPWTTAEHRIQAIEASDPVARRLDIAAGSACLVVERNTWNRHGPVTWVRFTYPAKLHTVVARFTPESRPS